jgi:hypothetical protein
MDAHISLEGWYAKEKYSRSVLSVNLNNVIVFTNSYLDEFNSQLTPVKHPDYANQILAYRKTVKPALKRIAKWTHLKELRNELLVHNYRFKDTSVFSATHQPKVYNAPFKDQEILLLGELILLINKQLLAFFPGEITQMLESNEKIIDRYKAVDNPIDFRKEIAALTEEVEQLKRSALKG